LRRTVQYGVGPPVSSIEKERKNNAREGNPSPPINPMRF
jgi:hypothetical protein